MFEVSQIETAPGLVFDVSLGGPDDGAPVLMLHGFCVSRHYFQAQVEALAAAGYRAIAPNQRGYAASARPDPKELDGYHIDLLIRDALDIVEAAGRGAPRFHLVGHDWGGSLSWEITDRWPERVASLTMLSRPHPRAFLRALAMPDGEQAKRSSHHKWLLEPDAVPKVLADNAKWVSDRLTRNGVPSAQIEAHLSVIGNVAAMEAAIAWYRARGAQSDSVAPTKVPTLYIWGDEDDTVGRAAAEGTAEFIVAPYRFEPMAGVGHYPADQVPERVSALLLEHIRKYPV